jgi:hypothetical protein
MAMTDLPKPEAGKTLEQSGSARQWQRVMEACELIESLAEGVQHPLRATRTANTLSLAVDIPKANVAAVAAAAGSAMRFVVIRDIVEPTDVFVTVQQVRPKVVNDAWVPGEYEAFGDEIQMPVYPKQIAGDYEAFVSPDVESGIVDETAVLTAIRVSGAWFLPQYLRFRLPEPSQSIPFGDCSPHIVGP